MKPKWEDAQKWARYLAKNREFGWNWFSQKPTYYIGTWISEGIMQACSEYVDSIDSLEERP